MNKIRITTHRYAYMGLAYDTIIKIACKLKGEYKNDVCFNHNGKQWTLSEGQGDFEYVDEEKIGVDTVEGLTEDNVVDEKEPILHSLYITPKDIGVFHKDVVNSPSHYDLFDGTEAIEIIARSLTKEEFRGYCFGNLLKYRLRCGKKDDVNQELSKADKYKELYENYKEFCRE